MKLQAGLSDGKKEFRGPATLQQSLRTTIKVVFFYSLLGGSGVRGTTIIFILLYMPIVCRYIGLLGPSISRRLCLGIGASVRFLFARGAELIACVCVSRYFIVAPEAAIFLSCTLLPSKAEKFNDFLRFCCVRLCHVSLGSVVFRQSRVLDCTLTHTRLIAGAAAGPVFMYFVLVLRIYLFLSHYLPEQIQPINQFPPHPPQTSPSADPPSLSPLHCSSLLCNDFFFVMIRRQSMLAGSTFRIEGSAFVRKLSKLKPRHFMLELVSVFSVTIMVALRTATVPAFRGSFACWLGTSRHYGSEYKQRFSDDEGFKCRRRESKKLSEGEKG